MTAFPAGGFPAMAPATGGHGATALGGVLPAGLVPTTGFPAGVHEVTAFRATPFPATALPVRGHGATAFPTTGFPAGVHEVTAFPAAPFLAGVRGP
jgi:hypothetical protein